MIQTLPLFHRIAGTPVMVVGEGEAAHAKRRLVERAGGVVVGPDNGDARLAFVAPDATGDVTANLERTVSALRARGVLVNVADRPDLCDFVVPSVLDRAPVLVAFGTGGASAGLSKALRLRFEVLLPPTLGRLADALYAARDALRARWPDAGDRRRALDAALAEGGPLDPLDPGSAGRVDAWLEGTDRAEAPGLVEIVLRGPDPDDLTLREARLLGSADLIAHEPGVAPQVLDRARADAARIGIAIGAPAPQAAGLVIILRA